MKVVRMTRAEFHAIPDNPIQRDTVTRARIYSKPGGHLAEWHPTHQIVAICETPDGKHQWKLDGHTRDYLWDLEELPYETNERLYVCVYEVADKNAAMEFYLCFDSDNAHETSGDKLIGAFRFHGFRPNHPYMFSTTGVMTAVKHLCFPQKREDIKQLTHVQLLKPWIRTFKQIDMLHPFSIHTRFPACVMAATMCTVRRDGVEALEFWQGFHDDAGIKRKTTVNGVFKADEVLTEFKNPTVVKARKGRRIAELTPRFIHCYERWQAKKPFPISVGRGGSHWKDAVALPQWWRDNIGDYDQAFTRSTAPENAAA